MTQQIGQPGRPKPAVDEKTTFRLTRVTSYADRLRKYKIKVDDEVIGDIKPKVTKEFSITPGMHKIVLSIDWCRSNIVEINIKDGETLVMECGSSVSGWKLLLSSIYVFFRPHRYLWLRTIGTE